MVLGCQQLLEEGGRERGEVGWGEGVQVHMLTEGGMDLWSLSPGLHIVLGHICLAVGLSEGVGLHR